jgi:hypothetical protein
VSVDTERVTRHDVDVRVYWAEATADHEQYEDCAELALSLIAIARYHADDRQIAATERYSPDDIHRCCRAIQELWRRADSVDGAYQAMDAAAVQLYHLAINRGDGE